ncbi:TRAP transporter small permease [Acidaminobacter hydrogenoformans]|uniref:TRAP-type C4-dicarboxylate transport system, small permease component n=1 Tax=Acidaminobacter hydrogenoformans DSM 2784 TaxID=1120920 RepID=A0A1G5RSW0_9FIRM|nr:TRAP transporter small permease [Acidaminobacter hydrogenoformans]SCZ76511.1 TRAP-type C4-dicarboxylate transport system, small permease component [Acidaminobacter hydrogenoformans DSM 2784]
MKHIDPLEKVLEFAAFLTFLALIATVTYQVVTRFAFPQYSVVWTEELTRYLFVYSIALAAPLAMKNREYVNVDIVLNIMGPKLRPIIQLILDAFSVGLFILTFLQGLKFIDLGVGNVSAAIGVPMVFPYASIAFMSFFIALYGLYNLVRDIARLAKGGEV